MTAKWKLSIVFFPGDEELLPDPVEVSFWGHPGLRREKEALADDVVRLVMAVQGTGRLIGCEPGKESEMIDGVTEILLGVE